MNAQSWLWFVIFAATLTGVAVGRYPGLRMNRATICLVGAVGLILTGAISLEQAFASLDLNTIALLFAMMVINANLRLAGFFRLAAHHTARSARGPRQLLGLLVLVAGVLSALFLNDTIVLVFTPLVLEVTTATGLHPVPFLVGLAVAANIGSTATVIGNPQNMLIGMSSGISFAEFTQVLGPVALLGLLTAWGMLSVIYRRELDRVSPLRLDLPKPFVFRPLLRKSLIASALLLAALLAGMAIPLAALAAASLLLVTRRIKPERVFQEIDWSLLVFFSGLFVVTHALETTGFGERLFAWAVPLATHSTATLTVFAALLSNVVSNVPAVLLFRPMVEGMPRAEEAYLVLAMATTFAGNMTLLGSVANLIVAETARRRQVPLSFSAYLRAGLPITLVTLALGILLLQPWHLEKPIPPAQAGTAARPQPNAKSAAESVPVMLTILTESNTLSEETASSRPVAAV